MRGTHLDRRLPRRESRIIPAYAGNTSFARPHIPPTRDHPRVCGEHAGINAQVQQMQGSSPRMRGTLRALPYRRITMRIIPAYAGNTAVHQSLPLMKGDHPRVCGEHMFNLSNGIMGVGSSPRMRGTPRPYGRRISRCGIIPAYAGNTCGAAPKNCITGDHPRVCGEHLDVNLDNISVPGSSPRMRGTPRLAIADRALDGIIPAYAGNTLSSCSRSSSTWDHPRVCGEHVPIGGNTFVHLGSSPRMRGTRCDGGIECVR